MESTTLTKNDYKNLLSFSEGLDPYNINFRRNAMNDLLNYFPFDGAAFPLVDHSGYYKHLVYVNFTPAAIQSYERDCFKKDFFAPANLKDISEKSVFTVEDLTSYVDYETSSLYSKCLRFNDFYYEALVLLRDQNSEPMGAIAVYHKKQSPGFTPREQKLLGKIGKIMEKATRIHLNHMSTENNLHFLSSIFNRHPLGMLLCNERFKIQDINQEAYHILESLDMPVNEEGARMLLHDYILPAYQEGGSDHFCLRLSKGLEVFLQNIISKEELSGNFITRYAVFLSLSKGENHASWTTYLADNGLTKRECEVADLLCRGYDLKETAQSLNISLNTVKRHKENIYGKLKVSRASQLILLYQDIKNSW